MLEIVITGRHDEYGGQDFLDRLCAAAAHNHRLLDDCGVEHRFTFVEWNPVEGRPPLADLIRERLPWWHGCLIVDREWHRALSTNPRLQFMEFFAKNAASRRSTADAILTTNSDVFLSSEVARAFAARTLDDRTVYRAVRIDVDRRIDWRTCGEAVLADPAHHLRVNDLQPPDYGNSAGDFLLMTPRGWMALGGFNERVRFAKIHKDGQFCVNARLEGYAFESLGPIYHLDHDGSYSNAGAAGVKGSPDAPYGPEWDYDSRYRNAASWGLSAAIDEPVGHGVVLVHHPSTHGPLLSVIEVADPSAAPEVNAALAEATGRFVVITRDADLSAFGGRAALTHLLHETTAGLIVPSGSSAVHPTLGRVPFPGTPYVIRRDVIDALVEWPEAEPDPALAFWLSAMERAEIAEAGPAAATPMNTQAPPRVSPSVEVATLMRRGVPVSTPRLEDAICERLAAARALPSLVAHWVASVAPDPAAACAVVGPDWATPSLIEALVESGRPLVGVFTALASEAGTSRWGHRFRPLDELADSYASHVLAGADARAAERLAASGCGAAFHVISGADDLAAAPADAELDGLRRAQARDLATPNITQVLARLPLLSSLEGERAWTHRYDAAQACDRAKRPSTALELYQDVMSNSPDLSLAMRAAFHTARLLIDRGAYQKAAPLLAKILRHNPAHRAARDLLDRAMTREIAV
ncbi:MAG: hypothetical protein HY657_03110 [Acidobacteria bacterium]|nr:hypothetical protein [Acidobacteriota bacterium]